jgi:5,10-methenyltetrahydrofolate synthetase
MQNKSELRRALLAARNAIHQDQRPLLDHKLSIKILAWQAAAGIKTLGVYWPMRGEADLHAAYAALVEQGVHLALPLVHPDAALTFVAWTPGEALSKDRFGTGVPAAAKPELRPEALLIPCLGFNRQCYRLGYGGGFYDRTLAPQSPLQPRPLAIGVAYAQGEVEFAADTYDIALDMIVTEDASFTAS